MNAPNVCCLLAATALLLQIARHLPRNEMTINIPDAPPRRTDRRPCDCCDCSAAGCRSYQWLANKLCCTACRGDHDQEPRP